MLAISAANCSAWSDRPSLVMPARLRRRIGKADARVNGAGQGDGNRDPGDGLRIHAPRLERLRGAMCDADLVLGHRLFQRLAQRGGMIRILPGQFELERVGGHKAIVVDGVLFCNDAGRNAIRPLAVPPAKRTGSLAETVESRRPSTWWSDTLETVGGMDKRSEDRAPARRARASPKTRANSGAPEPMPPAPGPQNRLWRSTTLGRRSYGHEPSGSVG